MDKIGSTLQQVHGSWTRQLGQIYHIIKELTYFDLFRKQVMKSYSHKNQHE